MSARLIKFDLPENGFAAAHVRLPNLPISIFIPDGVSVELKGEVGQLIRRLEIPKSSVSPVIQVDAAGGAVGSDGEVAGRTSRVRLSSSTDHLWAIGETKLSSDYLGSLEYIAVRHWPTLIAFSISSSIGPASKVAFLTQLGIVFALSSFSALYLLLFILGYLTRFILIGIVTVLPVLSRRSIALNVFACIAYPQLALWLIAFQFRNTRLKLLMMQLAILKFLSLLALLAGIFHLLAGDLRPGLAAVLTPASDPQGMLICIIPLAVLLRWDRPELSHFEDTAVSAVAAGVTSAGFALHWQSLLIQFALIPLTSFVMKPRYILIDEPSE